MGKEIAFACSECEHIHHNTKDPGTRVEIGDYCPKCGSQFTEENKFEKQVADFIEFHNGTAHVFSNPIRVSEELANDDPAMSFEEFCERLDTEYNIPDAQWDFAWDQYKATSPEKN